MNKKQQKITELISRIGEFEAQLAGLVEERDRLRERLWEANGDVDLMWQLQEGLLRALEYVAYVPVRNGEIYRHVSVARDALDTFASRTDEREEFLSMKEVMASLYFDLEDDYNDSED